MDIDYLLLLQQFRNDTRDWFTPFMEDVSLFAVTFLVMIPVFVYWTIDKKKGLYTLAAYYLCCGFNAVVKLTACVYRPWIRDPRVIPAGDAVRTATGYSFPSGHTATAGPIYGGLAIGVSGLVPLFFMIKFQRGTLDGLLGSHWGHFSHNFILVLYCAALYPLVIKAAAGFGRRDAGLPRQNS